ncbi:hypothetical protein SLI_5298 [Streptomyces lividans 1326]|uniref:Uncharacterized protein n=1 Tax=Streptomyces lividans 1326 TaxID=1200984 RepID=A0A7U9HES0_STRLI|nr:hypothetical protein SLI_5298 [Streptomyces lividans 1326]
MSSETWVTSACVVMCCSTEGAWWAAESSCGTRHDHRFTLVSLGPGG